MTIANIVEHSKASQPGLPVGKYDHKETADLPWDAPAEFRTVPAHKGPLRSKKAVGWKAENDVEAIATWLAEKAGASVNTAQAYRKETERFLFWLADHGMTVSDATREDYLRYGRFLLDPQPKEKWCSEKRLTRDNPDWKPFIKPLTPNSARHSLSVIKSLTTYLHEKGWLTANPTPDLKNIIKTQKIERSEEVEQRQIPEDLMAKLDDFAGSWYPAMPGYESTAKSESNPKKKEASLLAQKSLINHARLQVILALAGTLGARSSDLINGTFNQFRRAPAGSKVEMAWYIPSGKGGKAATLPVPADIVRKLKNLRVAMGLPTKFDHTEPPYPLLPNLKEMRLNAQYKGLSRSRLYRHVKSVFGELSEELKKSGDHEEAELISQASLHWLRHTAIKRVTRKTKDLTTAQKLARHTNINTTAIYATATLDELANALSNES